MAKCVDGGFQGFYVVPIGAGGWRNLLPSRIACSTKRAAKEINIQISAFALDGDDRIAFTLTDGWEADAAIDPAAPWSCKRDGTDPLRPKELPARFERRTIGETDWLVVARAADESDEEVIRLAGPFPHLAGVAHHPPR